jgi:predicted DNA-binding protein (UPF0251 family)
VIILEDVQLDEVIRQWATRESVTEAALKHNRRPLLNALPKDTAWKKVLLEKDDFESLRLINYDVSWVTLSNQTGRLDISAKNFEEFLNKPLQLPARHVSDGRTLQEYFDGLVKSLSTFRLNAANPTHNLNLILIGSNVAGPFTVLEGNHTAFALYMHYFIDNPTLNYPIHESYLGTSDTMTKCRWYYPK